MILDFLYKIYVMPIKYETGHNVLDILTYAVLFLAFTYGFYLAMKKMNTEIGFKFFISAVPFIFAGALLRAMVDNLIYPRNFFTITPGVYAVFAFAFAAAVFLGLFAERIAEKNKLKFEYWKTVLIIGVLVNLALFAPKITKIQLENTWVILACLLITGICCTAVWLVAKRLGNGMDSKMSQAAIYSQIFDGATTSALMQFVGGIEKHPLPRMLIQVTGTPFAFLATKILLAFGVAFMLNKYIEDKNLRNSLFIAITVVGLGPGLRNLLSYFIVSLAPHFVLF